MKNVRQEVNEIDISTQNETIKYGDAMRVAVFLSFFVAFFVLTFRSPFCRMFFTAAGSRDLIVWLDKWVSHAGIFGPLAFIVIYTFGSLVFSTIPMNAAGAILFGKINGICFSFIGCMFGSILGFYIGRFFLAGAVRRRFINRIAGMEEKIRTHGFTTILYLRLVGFPYAVLKFAAGASGVSFRSYFWGSFLGIIPPIIIESFFFGRMKEILSNYKGVEDFIDTQLLVPLIIFVFSLLFPLIIKIIKGCSSGLEVE